jgi:hypothetical protein
MLPLGLWTGLHGRGMQCAIHEAVYHIEEYRVVWRNKGGSELVRQWASKEEAVTHLARLPGARLDYAHLEIRTVTITYWDRE